MKCPDCSTELDNMGSDKRTRDGYHLQTMLCPRAGCRVSEVTIERMPTRAERLGQPEVTEAQA